jgi:hypothetical protein
METLQLNIPFTLRNYTVKSKVMTVYERPFLQTLFNLDNFYIRGYINLLLIV